MPEVSYFVLLLMEHPEKVVTDPVKLNALRLRRVKSPLFNYLGINYLGVLSQVASGALTLDLLTIRDIELCLSQTDSYFDKIMEDDEIDHLYLYSFSFNGNKLRNLAVNLEGKNIRYFLSIA